MTDNHEAGRAPQAQQLPDERLVTDDGGQSTPEGSPAQQLNPYHQEPHEFDPENPGGDAADRQ